MATVPAEITFTAGSILTAAQLNTNLRDAINFLINAPVCQCRQTVGQSIANTTAQSITFDTEDVDNDGMHSTVTNTDRLTAVTAGRYTLGGGVSYPANGTGSREADWFVNATVVNGGGASIPATAAAVQYVATRAISVFLNVGDFITLGAFQSSGGALTTPVTNVQQSIVCARWVGTT